MAPRGVKRPLRERRKAPLGSAGGCREASRARSALGRLAGWAGAAGAGGCGAAPAEAAAVLVVSAVSRTAPTMSCRQRRRVTRTVDRMLDFLPLGRVCLPGVRSGGRSGSIRRRPGRSRGLPAAPPRPCIATPCFACGSDAAQRTRSTPKPVRARPPWVATKTGLRSPPQAARTAGPPRTWTGRCIKRAKRTTRPGRSTPPRGHALAGIETGVKPWFRRYRRSPRIARTITTINASGL